MSKKKRQARQKIAKTLVSVFVLIFFLGSAYLSGQWAVSMFRTKDPRKVVPVAQLQVRAKDKTSTPLVPFNEPVVSVTFDDGWESVYTHALPILQKYGVHTTQYIITGVLDNYLYMSLAQLKSMHNNGHDLAAHTVSHLDLTTLDDTQLKHELNSSQQSLARQFGPIRDFTSPYGAYNAHTLQMISKYYRSQKNAEGDPTANALEAINVKDGFDALNLKSYSVRRATTLDDIKKLMKNAQDNHGWLILTYHQIDNSGEAFSVTPENFEVQMKLISEADIRVITVGRVLDTLLPDQMPRY